MGFSQEEVLARMTPEMRAKVEARTRQLIEEEKSLSDLRRVKQLTQTRMAGLLGIAQDSVSRLERRADMLLSTMSSYVEAMGGRLRLIAEFPDRPPVEVRLADLTEPPPPRRRKRKPAQTPASAAGKDE